MRNSFVVLSLVIVAVVNSYPCGEAPPRPAPGSWVKTPSNCAALQANLRTGVAGDFILFPYRATPTTCPQMRVPSTGVVAYFAINRNCNYASQCVLHGNGTGELSGDSPTNPGSYVLYMAYSQYWWIQDITISNGGRLVVMDHSAFICLYGIVATRSGSEAIHFRYSTSYSALINSVVNDTGNYDCGFGDAVFIGSDPANEEKNGKQFDFTNNIHIEENVLGPQVSAEMIDVKDRAHTNVIKGNLMYGDDIRGDLCNAAFQFVDLKGPRNKVSENILTFTTSTKATANTFFFYGISAHSHSRNGAKSDCAGNIVWDNEVSLPASGVSAVYHQCRINACSNVLVAPYPATAKVDDNLNLNRNCDFSS